jgi:hypothetical protein
MTREQIAKWKRWGVLFIGVAIALFGEPLAGSLLMLGYEVGFRNGREILRSQS